MVARAHPMATTGRLGRLRALQSKGRSTEPTHREGARSRRATSHPPARAVVAPPRLRSFPPFFSAPLRTSREAAAAAAGGHRRGAPIPAEPCGNGVLFVRVQEAPAVVRPSRIIWSPTGTR